ncbi:hypothetical protein ID866_10490 [Astraeus odoratus]|nr:hypothetical protein ID866_10490 [Astraeus odoratus]
MRQNMINTLSIERPTTQQPPNNQQCDCNQHISSTMFMGLESKSLWQVDIHPSAYIMEEDPINKDKEDQHALAHTYAQVEELCNNIKKRNKHALTEWKSPPSTRKTKALPPTQAAHLLHHASQKYL